MNSSSELNKESKNIFKKLKNDYFLQLLFNINMNYKNIKNIVFIIHLFI